MLYLSSNLTLRGYTEYTDTENCTHKKAIKEPNKHDDEVSYPEPDILEYEVN